MGATSSSSTPRDGGRSGGGVHVLVPLRRRAHRASHPSCTTPTTPKQTNVTLHPAADGSTRITSPRILTSASAFAGTSPPRRRRSALVGSPSRTTSCALSLFQSLMVSSIDKVGSRVTALATIQSDDNVHVIDVIDSKKLPPPYGSSPSVTLSHHIRRIFLLNARQLDQMRTMSTRARECTECAWTPLAPGSGAPSLTYT